MNVFQNIENYTPETKCVLTIGTFDGLHIGHQKIIKELVKLARDQKKAATILTFFPHPRMVLQKESNLKLIDTLEEKKNLLEKLGIDNLIIHPFSKSFSRLSAREFCRDILAEQLKISTLFIGYDHRFGKNREATAEDLIAYGKLFDFDIQIIPAQVCNEITVSSTKVRKAIDAGDFEQVSQFLGRYFELRGTVVKGQGIGRTLQFPTANIQIEESYKLIPPRGVYLVKAQTTTDSWKGMMNIGVRPTINGENQTLEVHLFECESDLYNKELRLSFLEKIREEQKFDSLEELKIQLEKDKEICKRTLAEKYLH